MTPDQYCQHKAAPRGSSFYYASLFLPPEKRRAITALQAFCRELDDIVEECADSGVAAAKLAWWRNEVAALFSRSPQHPVTRALAPLVEPYRITRERLGELLDGTEMDLRTARYPDFGALDRSCLHVAGVAGMLAANTCGYRNPQTLQHAAALGRALRLTRIIRDVGADARRHRIYLPLDELARFQVSAADILAARHTAAFGQLIAYQIERAEQCCGDALALLPPEDRRAQRPGLVLAAIHRALLAEIRRDGGRVLAHRIALTPIRQLWLAWRTWLSA